MNKKQKMKNILVYVLKVIALFSILYFTFEQPTGLVLLLYMSPILYIILYFSILFITSKIFSPKVKSNHFFHKHVIQPILLIIGIGVVFVLLYGVRYFIKLNKEAHINQFIELADEVVYYNTNTHYFNGVENDKIIHSDSYRTDTILIDYDAKRIGFLFGPFKEFVEFKLARKELQDPNEKIQLKIELNSPGLSLITFSPNEMNNHRTSSIELIMEDGTIYSITNLVEEETGYYYHLGLNMADYKLKAKELSNNR